jgi:putative heme-binding domain-containing protein
MRRLAALTFAATTLLAQDPTPLRPLCDGQSLAGWRGDPKLWRVEDGALVGSSVGTDLAHNTFLVHDGAVPVNFEFVALLQVEGDNNSGIQYRSQLLPGDGFRVAGPQCDLHGKPSYTAMLYDEQGAGIVAEHGLLRRWRDDGITTLGTLAIPRQVELRQWHEVRIVALGELVWHELDGVVVTAYLDQRREPAQGGVLALQLHRGAPMTVRCRWPQLRGFADAAAMQREVPVPPAVVGWLAQDAARNVARAAATAAGQSRPLPQWLWDASPGADEECFFRGPTLRLPRAPQWAELVVAADNHCRVYVNGERVGQGDAWESPLRLKVRQHLRPGDNVIAVHAWNDGGPAGIVVQLTGQHAEGEFTLVSDASWRVGDDDPDGWQEAGDAVAAWPAATVLGALGAAGLPWTSVHGEDAFGLFGDPLGAQVAVVAPQVTYPGPLPAPGAAELAPVGSGPSLPRRAWPEPVLQLLEVPRSLGSFVSLAATPSGQLYAGAQRGGLFRITPAARAGQATTIERVALDVGGAHGLLWWRQSLYVVQNEQAPGLYRLTDRDGDGALDHKELLQALEGSGEHGPHSVLVAPDGEHLLVVAGNHTKLPPLAGSRVPLGFAEDRLLPRLDDPHDYWEGHSPPGGWVCQCDADGKQWELLTCGFRNPYDAAVLQSGDVVVYDADMEWDLGMPWYRPTRLLYVISGVDYGWRLGSAKWPTDYPDAPPALAELGPGSPTGMAVQRQFDGKVEHTLALDWTFGIAYRDGKPWLLGTPLPLCDVAVGDGATYLVTGGRGLPSQLLRVPEGHDQRQTRLNPGDTTHLPLAAEAATVGWPEFVRRVQFHVERGLVPVSTVHEARAALERQPVSTWREAAIAVAPEQPLLALQALLALARQGSAADLQPVLDALGKHSFAALAGADRIAWLRVHALAVLRLGPCTDAQRAAIAARLLPLFPTGDERQDADLAELLAHVQADGFVAKAVAQLRPAAVPAWAAVATRDDVYGKQYGGVITAMAAAMPPVGQLAIADALRTVRHGWTLAQRRDYFRFLQQARQQKGGASYDGFCKRLLEAAWATCSEAEQSELAMAYAAAKADAPKFQATPPQGPGQDWQLGDLDAVLQPGLDGADVARGRNLFHAASCAACHYFAGEGGGRGPDLTSLATRFGARDVLEAIVAPSAVVSDQYTGQVLTTTSGQAHFGAVTKGWFGDLEVYELMPAEPGSLLQRFPVAQVATVAKSPLSPMPADLCDRLSAAELRDLVKFLLSQGRPPAAK